MKEYKYWHNQQNVDLIDKFWRESEQEQAHRQRVLASIFPRISKEYTILDIGCGSGLFMELLRGVGRTKYTGMDYSNLMLKKVRYPVPLIQGSIFDLPLKDNAFDVVLSIDVLSHLSEIEIPLKEIARVTKRLAFLTLWTTYDGTRDISQELRVKDLANPLEIYPESIQDMTKTPYVAYNFDNLKTILEKVGVRLDFMVERLETIMTQEPGKLYYCSLITFYKPDSISYRK